MAGSWGFPEAKTSLQAEFSYGLFAPYIAQTVLGRGAKWCCYGMKSETRLQDQNVRSIAMLKTLSRRT